MLVCPQPHRQSFQSTLPHGSDRGYSLRAYLLLTISIHAPVVVPAVISIHAPSRERLEGTNIVPVMDIFQSTLPHGSDHGTMQPKPLLLVFQSTLPYGSDYERCRHRICQPISIHAPLRERLRVQRCSIMPEHFNPRSLAGATCYFGSHTYDTRIPIHAPSRERLLLVPVKQME